MIHGSMPGYPTDRTSIWYVVPFTIGTYTQSRSVGVPKVPVALAPTATSGSVSSLLRSATCTVLLPDVVVIFT